MGGCGTWGFQLAAHEQGAETGHTKEIRMLRQRVKLVARFRLVTQLSKSQAALLV